VKKNASVREIKRGKNGALQRKKLRAEGSGLNSSGPMWRGTERGRKQVSRKKKRGELDLYGRASGTGNHYGRLVKKGRLYLPPEKGIMKEKEGEVFN